MPAPRKSRVSGRKPLCRENTRSSGSAERARHLGDEKKSPSPMAALLQLESSQHNASDCESALRELASRMMKIIFLGGYLHNSSAGMRQRMLPPQRPSKRTAVSFSTSQRRDRGGLKPHFLEVLPGHRGNLMRGMSILLSCCKSGAPPKLGKNDQMFMRNDLTFSLTVPK